jgi:hypothetical protein
MPDLTPPSPITARYKGRVEALQWAFRAGYEDLDHDQHGNDCLKPKHAARIRHLGLSLLEDLFGRDHRLFEDFAKATSGEARWASRFDEAYGITEAVETMVKDDWLTKSRAAVAAAMFADYLEQAEHLAEQGMYSAAVVIAMGSLEVHLHRMCEAKRIGIDSTDKDGYTRRRAADVLNAELKKAEAYGSTEQKQIVTFLDVRKHAAHGDHEKVNAASVQMLIPWVRMFINSHPA